MDMTEFDDPQYGCHGYPRRGHPLAPSALREILDVAPPVGLSGSQGLLRVRSLAELDETAWSRFDLPTCMAAADAIVCTVRAAIHCLPAQVSNCLVPQLPPGMRPDEIELETRTHNCLARRGLLRRPEALRGVTIGELVALPNFGAKCLVDLLSSLEGAGATCFDDAAQSQDSANGLLNRGEEPVSESGASGIHASEDATIALHQIVDEVSALVSIPGAVRIRGDDLRLRPWMALLPFPGETLGAKCEALLADLGRSKIRQGLLPLIREFRQEMFRISGMKLESELQDLCAACWGQSSTSTLWRGPVRPSADVLRSASIAASRLGWDGKGARTLEAVGHEFGITRERVRQICVRTVNSFQGRTIFAPALDRALALASEGLPLPANAVESRLTAEGISAGPFMLEGLLSAAKTLNRGAAFAVEAVGEVQLVVAPDTRDLLEPVARFVRRSIEHWGAATVEDIAAQVSAGLGRTVESLTVESILIGQDGFSWLDKTSGWFWLRSVPRNRLLNQIKKILSVVGQIEVSELRAGVGRHHRMQGFAPPRRVLRELAAQAHGYRVDGDTIIAEPGLDWRNTLSGIECTLAEILLSHDGIMSREELERECVSRGMNRSSFYVYLDYSPIMVRYARGVYGLRGASVSPGTVESLAPRRRRGRVLIDYGWTSDGKIWLAFCLSKAMVISGVFGVPSGMKQFLQGEFSLRLADRSPIGTLFCAYPNAWGLGPMFRRRGGEEGDYLVLVVDLGAREVAASLGDAGIIEAFRDSAGPLPTSCPRA